MTYGYGNFRSNPTDCPHGRTCLATRQIYRPGVITENFEFVNYEESAERLDYWLDERGYMSREDYKKGTVREYGFTEE
ncbi:MAG: hypothetical protein PUE39_06565, partial [bacterium]|nr:hypothetical protein [bacterium]